MSIENLKEGLKLIEQGQAKLASGPFGFYMKKVISAYDYLLANCAPFQVGDRVEIVKNIDFSKCQGWEASKHFLCIGNKAVVRGVDWSSEGKFLIEIEPDNQTFFYRGKESPVSDPHVYTFAPSYLRHTVGES